MLLARREKLTYQIGFSLFSGMVSFLPSAGALPVVDENFSHVGVDPNNPAQMNTSGAVMDINGTKQNNVIGWRDFSVGAGETVRFDGGSHTKNYLNMVTGNVSSAIYGTIQGGKDVYIINPHGVLFGNGASVNVGNLYASTQNINPATVINAANAANTAGTDVAASAVLGTYTDPTKAASSSVTADDGKSYTNTSVSHLADVVSLIDDSGSVVADKVVVVGGHVRFMNSGRVTATSGVEAYYDQQDTAIDGYVHVGNDTGANAGWVTNSGKSVDYYKLVGTAGELQAMNSGKSGNYMLRSDVDMTGETWTPVGTGTGANAFTGKFDGMMHEVQNLTISGGANQGLFGTTSGARIDNVGVVNPNFQVASGGAIVGNARNNTKLRAVYAEGGTIQTTAATGGASGGLVGILEASTLDTAYSTSTINHADPRTGGLVGTFQNARIKNAYFAGTLVGSTQWGVYGRLMGTNTIEHVYFTTGSSMGNPVISPPIDSVVGASQVTRNMSTYTTASQDWDISNTGGTNSIWRIYEGQTNPLLTAFMKGTIEADVSTKEYARAKNPDGSYIGPHASTDSTFSAYTQEAKGPTALKGKDIDQVYDANVIKYVKNDGSAITSATDVDFLHKLESSDYDNITVDNSGVRNVAATKSYIYSNQKGYDIVGGNATIKKRDISSSSAPIKVASKVYDGETTVSKDALQAALDNSVTSFSGILADDRAVGLKLVATDTLATYTNTGYNADNTTYTGTNARDAGYNKRINTTGAINVEGMTSTEANNYNLNAADIVVTGDITQREIYVGLHKTTGIDKTYDATSDVRELTSKTPGGTNWAGGTEGVAPDENIYVDESDEAHKILAVDSDTSVDYANSTAKYYNGTTEAVDAGTHDVKYDNITLTGSGKANYKLLDKNDHAKVIYAAAMQGAASGASDAVDRSGTLDGKGTINRRELDKETFQVLSGSGTVSEATKVYDNTSVYDSGSGAFKMMTSVIVDDQGADKDANLAAEKTGILKSEIDKIAFTVTTGKGTFKQGDRTTDAVDAAGAARAQYVAYDLTATNEDTTKNWLGNYKLVDKTTSPETVTNLAHNTTTDIIAKGTITKRALYVDLGKKTGIDKVYDAGTGVANAYTIWNERNTTAAANGGAVYSGASLTNEENRLVAGDGTSMKVTASYDNKNVIRGINGDNAYTDAAGYETVNDNTHSVNYTVAVDGAKSYNYVLVDQSSIPSDLNDKLKSTAAATNASVDLAGKGKITPAELTVSFGHVTKQYDKTADLKASDRNRQPILSGLQGGETITVATVGQPNGYSAAYSDANVADGKTVNYTNLSLSDTAKNYKIKTVTGETVGYSSDRTGSAFTPTTYDVTGKGDIKKATITYIKAETAAASKIYDGGKQVEYNGSAALADVKNYITSVTVKNGDGVEFNAAGDVELSKAEYSDKNAGTGKNIDYTFTVSNIANYNNSETATYTATNGTIEKREVELDSVVNGNLTRAYMGSNEVGAYDTSGATATALTGDSLVTFKHAAHVTGGVADQGDDTGLIAGDAVTNGTTATYDTGNVKRDSSRNVRTGAHDVTYNLALSGADAGNYRIVNAYSTTSTPATDRTTAAGHGTITPRTIDATVGKITKTYNAKVAAENISSAVSVGVLFGETATIKGEYQANSADPTDRAKDVGTNKDVNYTVDLGTSTVGSDTYNINDNYDIQQGGTTVSYDANGNAQLKGKGDITKATLAVQTSEDVRKTYNGNADVTTGQGTVSAVAAGGTNGLQTDDAGHVDTVTFTVADSDKKYTGFTKSDGTVRSASDANANASDPDSTAMLWRVAYENVQAAGADLKNYTLVGAAAENKLASTGADMYKITGKGRIDRVALADSALTMTVGNATKVYDGTTAVKYNEAAADAYKYLTNVTVDLGGGNTETFDSSNFAKVAAEYTTDKNVASNTTATNNIKYTITLGSNIGNDNYTIGSGVVTRTGTGTITARDVKATLAHDAYTKVYDGTTDVKVGSAVAANDALITLEAENGSRGWLAGETGTLTRTAAYDTKNVSRNAGGAVQSDKRITYTNTYDSADTAANYRITYVAADGSTPVNFTTSGLTSTHTTAGVHTITPKDVTIDAPSADVLKKTWDNNVYVVPTGGDGRLGIKSGDIISGDTVTLNHPASISTAESGKYTAAYDSSDAGNRTVTYSDVKLEGGDAGNYNIRDYRQNGAGGASGTLTPNSSNTYDLTVNGSITQRAVDANQIKVKLDKISKTYDGTKVLKHTDAGTTTEGKDALKKYISSIVLDLGGSTYDLSGAYEVGKAEYTDANRDTTGNSLDYALTITGNGNYTFTGGTAAAGGTQFTGTVKSGDNTTASGALSIDARSGIEITQRNVDVTIGEAVKTYDGTTAVTGNSGASPAITTPAGLLRFETQNNTTNTGWVTTDTTPTSVSGAYNDKNAGTGKSVVYDITYGANDLTNYKITYKDGTNNNTVISATNTGATDRLTTTNNEIRQREVGLNTKQGITKVYDGTTAVDGTTAAANAVLELEDSAGGTTGVIAADKPNLTVNIGSKAYDSKNVMGAEGSTIHYTNVSLTGSEAGNYKLVSGTAPGNSNFTNHGSGFYSIDGTGTITPKTLTIKTGTGVTKVYDGTTAVDGTTAAANAVLSLNGVIGSDTVNIKAGYNRAYADKNVKGLEGSTINYSNIELDTTSADAKNYTLADTTATGTGTITKRNVDVTIGKAVKTYDRNTDVTGNSDASPAITTAADLVRFETQNNATNTGWVTTDTKPTSVSGVYDDKNAGTGKSVTYDITYGANDLTNYNITYKDATNNNTVITATNAGATDSLTTTNNTITPKAVSVTAPSYGDLTKTYDKTTHVRPSNGSNGRLSVDGIISGDTVTLNHPASISTPVSGEYSAAYDRADAGDRNVTYSGVKLEGADAGNYTLVSFTQAGAGGASGTLTANAAGLYSFDVRGHIESLPLDINRLKINLKDITKTYDGTDALKKGSETGGDAWKSYIQDIYLELSPTGSPSSKVYLSTDDITVNSVSYTDVNAGTGKSIRYDFKLKNDSNYSFKDSSGQVLNSFSGTIGANHTATDAAGTSGISTKNIDITKRNVDVTIGSVTKEYDGKLDATAPTVTYERENGDRGWVEQTDALVTGVYRTKDVSVAGGVVQSNKEVDWTFTHDALKNYTVTYTNAVGPATNTTATTDHNTITPKTLTAVFGRADKTYDRTNTVTGIAATNPSLTGFVAGEEQVLPTGAISKITGTYGSAAGEAEKDVARDADGNIIDKPVNYTGVKAAFGDLADNGNFKNTNYTIDDRATGTGRINPKEIRVNAGTGAEKEYDGTTAVDGTAAAANAQLTLDGADIIPTDIVAIDPNSYAKSREYDTENVVRDPVDNTVILDKTIHYRNVSLTGKDAGNYTLVAGADASNVKETANNVYSVDGKGKINPKRLTWGGSTDFGFANKTYDGTDDVENALDNILSLSGVTGTNSGNAVSGIVNDEDRAKIRAGLKVTGKYMEKPSGAGNAADAAEANVTSSTIGVDANGNRVTGEEALIDHNVTYQISVDPMMMDATTAANYDFREITAGTDKGRGSINRAELTVETDSLTVPMDTAVPAVTGRVRGAVVGGEAVRQNDFSYGIDDASYHGTGEGGATLKGSTRLRPAYRLAGKYNGKTSGNYGKNYRFKNQYGSLDVKLSAPGSEDTGAKNALTDARRFTPDDFAWYDASLTDKKGKTYYREPKALVERIEPSVKIDGALTVEEALLSTIPSGFGDYTGFAVVPVAAGKQDAPRTQRRLGTPEEGVKLTLLLNTDAPEDEDALEDESEEAKILARRRAMISIQTEGLGVAM